jgi:hypothetical protein
LLVGCFEPWWPRTLTDPSPSVTAVVKWWLDTIHGLSLIATVNAADSEKK